MIEQLESRTLFSLTPHAALIALRSDLASVGQQIKTMIAANKSAIANLNHDLTIFPYATYVATDKPALLQLNLAFNTQLLTLQADFNSTKTLLGLDITQLINRSNAYNRHPTNSIGLAVQASQQLLTAQGNSSLARLSSDTNQMQASYLKALTTVSNLHPLDATLVTRASHISTAFAANVQLLQSAASTVAITDIPNFITALEPNGVITGGTA
jgi:hypothetical protein